MQIIKIKTHAHIKIAKNHALVISLPYLVGSFPEAYNDPKEVGRQLTSRSRRLKTKSEHPAGE